MNANLWTQLLIAIVPALITGVGSLIIAIKKCKNEINTLETNNKHEIEKLMKQHKIDIEALNEKHRLDIETKEKEHQLKIEVLNLLLLKSFLQSFFENLSILDFSKIFGYV